MRAANERHWRRQFSPESRMALWERHVPAWHRYPSTRGALGMHTRIALHWLAIETLLTQQGGR